VIDDGAGASHSAPNQRTFEVYHRDGLTIRRAMEGMPLLQRQVFVAHYLASGNAGEKAKILGLSKSRYWAILDTAYYYLAGRIDATA
jgi:DNA-directed RNA polymerase specialized sigma24 family protein